MLSAAAYATGGDDLEAPAVTVGESLDFLPGKSLGEIFLEAGAEPSDDEAIDLSADVLQIAERLRAEPATRLLPAVDQLLAQARQHYASRGDWCNLLHDVRDVVAGSAADKNAAADYIKWRVENKEMFFHGEGGGDASELEKRAQAATGTLKVHWLYLCGAATYRAGDREACRKWFQQVVREFPKHPRAEIALFMDARCAFAASRKDFDPYNQTPPDAVRMAVQERATKLFERYLQQYPQGRFVADSLGWLGALAFDGGDYLKALEDYIAQAETPAHPETLKSAIFMCERSLAAVAAKPDGDAAFVLIARHPRIAMGFTYLVLSAMEADNYDGKYDTPADVKKWRRTILPRIAAAVAKQKQFYKSGDWQPRYLALLAQAASASGNQAQALQITNLSPAELAKSDDLLLVRAIAFQRAGKAPEAIATYRQLLAQFPNDTIVPGVRVRLAFALQDQRDASGALIEFLKLIPDRSDNPSEQGAASATFQWSPYTGAHEYPEGTAEWALPQSAVYPNITGANLEQVQSAIETLLNFAPLAELTPALESSDLTDDEKNEVRAVIAQRFLVLEDFAAAKKFMSPEQFGLVAQNLEALTAAARGNGAQELARLGNAWAAARGKLLRAPLGLRLELLHRGVSSLTELRRNGQSLGMQHVDDALEQRDELRHAARWWLAAARATPGTPLAAETRWKALETMPKIARASEYAEERAREIKGEAVSREIYARLQKECPDSVQAKRLAAYWSFPPAPADASADEYVDPQVRRDAHLLGYSLHDFSAFLPEQSEEGSPEYFAAIKRVALLPGTAGALAPPAFAQEVRDLDAIARKNSTSTNDATLINFLDDLAQVCGEPGVTGAMQKTYCAVRYNVLQSNGSNQIDAEQAPTDNEIRAQIDEALRDPAMQPVADYLEFSRIGLVSGDRTKVETDIVDPKDDNAKVTITSRDYAKMEKMTRDFLQKYPRSQKREAALFVLARSIQELSRPQICIVGIPVPDGGFDLVEKPYQAEPFDPKRVLAALDDYDRAFPHGRYAAEVRNLRAMTLWRTHDWARALDLTIAQLDDTANPDLSPEASVRLANIFAALEQAEYRSDLIEAIRARPGTAKYLQLFLARATNDRTHPLRYLQAYLSDKLNLRAVADVR
ncbi:MAG: hypothetical protein ABIU29_04530 [Chthoniobacterales bacterium]